MMPKITDFVSRRLLLRRLFGYFMYFNLIQSRRNFPSNKFKLGDWVINHYTVIEPDDLEYNTTYNTVGYITGIVVLPNLSCKF